MDRRKKIVDLVKEQGIVPIYSHPDAYVSIRILHSLYKAGCRVIEYSHHGENAVTNFLQLRKVADKELPGLQLGAGRIKNKIEATEYINEGANFIACPGVIEAVATLADNNDLLWIPTCATPTEVILADELGALLVKLFPGSLSGPSYLAAIKEIFPGLWFMPTGNVDITEESITNWFKSGASAIESGTNLINGNLVETKDYDGLESLTRQALQVVQKIRKP
jgi:2-dehydro-3-deoxyphosphogluconate aldolase/(4S)-4-hydroxy-2-oxoglutarate aldolase